MGFVQVVNTVCLVPHISPFSGDHAFFENMKVERTDRLILNYKMIPCPSVSLCFLSVKNVALCHQKLNPHPHLQGAFNLTKNGSLQLET